jgi:predicted permease
MECALIAAMAAMVGLALSGYGARLLAVGFNIIDPGAAPEDTTPYWVNLTMNHSAYFFVGVIALVSTFAFGLVPALQLSRTDVIATLKDNARSASGSPSARRWTAGLMVGQLALTMILLSATALLWRNFIAATNADVIETSDLVTARFTLPLPKYDPARRQQLLHQYSTRIAASGAVGAATLATSTPFEPPATRLLSIEGRPAPANEPLPTVGVVQTDGQFFSTVKLPIVRGRAFSGTAGTTEVVINERLAALFFADGDAIGRRIRLIETPGETASRSLTIAGIARAMPVLGRGVPDRLIVYLPWDAFPESPRTLTVIARGSVRSAVVSTLREELRTLDPGVPLFGVEPLAAAVARTAYPQRLLGTWFGLLAAIALVLAVVGLYATTAYGVVRRTQEIGVRMALGARTAQVFLLFMRQAIWRITLGLTIGLGGALGLGRLLSSFLERTGPRDPLTLTAVAVLLAGAGATASLLPALRAARIDPADALRAE